MKTNNKQNLIAIREKQRTYLQVKNLATTMRGLKEDLALNRGLGLSLPAVESVAGKLGTAARKYQEARYTEEKEYKWDKTDQELTEDEIRKQIQDITDEIKEIPYDLKHRIEDREPEKETCHNCGGKKAEKGQTLCPECKEESNTFMDTDQETEEVLKIEKELEKDDQTKIW